MDGLKELGELVNKQGPVVAGWLLLLAGVAWIAGHGAKAAIKNVASILRMNEDLREQLSEQLGKANDARDEADRRNVQLRQDLADATRRMDDLAGRLLFAERRATRLEDELLQVQAENQRLRSLGGAGQQ